MTCSPEGFQMCRRSSSVSRGVPHRSTAPDAFDDLPGDVFALGRDFRNTGEFAESAPGKRPRDEDTLGRMAAEADGAALWSTAIGAIRRSSADRVVCGKLLHFCSGPRGPENGVPGTRGRIE